MGVFLFYVRSTGAGADEELASQVAALEVKALSQMSEASKRRDTTALRSIVAERQRLLRQLADQYPESKWDDLSDQDVAALSDLYVRVRQYGQAIELSSQQRHRKAAAVKLNHSVIRSYLFLGDHDKAGQTLLFLEDTGEGPLGDLNYPIAHAHASAKEWTSAWKFSERSIEHLLWSIDNEPEAVGMIRLRVKLHAFIVKSLFGTYLRSELRDLEVSLIDRINSRGPNRRRPHEELSQLLYFELLFSTSLDIENSQVDQGRLLSRWAHHIAKCSKTLDSQTTLLAVGRFVALMEAEQRSLNQQGMPTSTQITLVAACLKEISTPTADTERVRDTLIRRCEVLRVDRP